MKKIILLNLLLLSIVGYTQNAPINFETPGNGANWTWITFENGANTALQMVPNPDTSGINTSTTVGKITVLTNSAPFAGVESIHQLSNPSGAPAFGSYVVTSSNCTVKIMVYKSVISDVGIKFVNATNGSLGEIKKANTLVDQWEELIFDFSSRIGQTNDQIVIFPDFQSSRSSDNICYIDNITFSQEVEKPVLPLNFESSTAYYSFSNFGNAITTKVTNPYSSGINTSSTVAKLRKNPGETWAGSFIELGTAIDFSSINTIKMKVYSPFAGKVFKLKLENISNATYNVEINATNTTANAWEELTFTFPGIVNANSYKRVVMFCNFGEAGIGENYYFDDIRLNTNMSIDDNDWTTSIKLYPNPCSNEVSISSEEMISDCSLYNSLGQFIAQYPMQTTNQTIDVSNLESGLYIMKLRVQDKMITRKIMKK